MGNPQMKYQSSASHIHLVVYHLISCSKYRRAVLVDQTAARLEQIIRQVVAENKWEILGSAIRPDQVHLFARADPVGPAYQIVRVVKGRSFHLLRQEFPHLRRLPSLWTHSYFCSTAGKVSAPGLSSLDPVGFGPSWYDAGQGTGRARADDTIQRYIEAQDTH